MVTVTAEQCPWKVAGQLPSLKLEMLAIIHIYIHVCDWAHAWGALTLKKGGEKKAGLNIIHQHFTFIVILVAFGCKTKLFAEISYRLLLFFR